MEAQYSTALSYLILAGSSIFCLVKVGNETTPNILFSAGTYSMILTNSLLGVWRHGNPRYGRSIDRLHRFTTFVQNVSIMPLILTPMCYVSISQENYFGVATSTSFVINHYALENIEPYLDSVPPDDLYNYGLCFLNYFALRATAT